MNTGNAVYTFLICLAVFFVLQYSTGCFKEEYSYEGGPSPDTLMRPDPLPVPADTTTTVDTVLTFAPCAACKYATSITLGQWNFQYDTSFLCGTVTNAVMSPEKNAFTFFGPSDCTPGTGLIITAYFDPVTFDNDRAGVQSNRVSLRYYDNNNTTDIFSPGAQTQFSITINQF
ncbi:MAG TPA: hypothetical protein VM187_07260, partial [Niastella sp.]|nr:hypothetical protein [Niastella sp.]